MRIEGLPALVCAAGALCWSLSAAEPASDEQGECRVSRGMQSNEFLKAAVPATGKIIFAPKGPGFVDRDGALGIKFPWWRLAPGSLVVGGRRLDREAAPARAYMNHGYGEQGFLPTYLVFPTPGCWEITGRLGAQSLTFVVLVEKVGDGPDWRFEGLPNDRFWYQTTL
jgi:hypothetical protein